MKHERNLLWCGALLLLSGCAAAVGAGAGVGSTLYLTSRGAEATVPADIEAVERATRSTFTAMGITIEETETEESGAERGFTGKAAAEELTVTVEMKRSDTGATHVEVRARETPVTWDKDYARRVLTDIVRRTTGKAPTPPETS